MAYRDNKYLDIEFMLKNMGNHKILSAKEEKELIKKAKKGDLVARDKIIMSNFKLVYKTAKAYIGSKLSLSDLVGEGFMGVIKAIDGYDFSKNCRFSTYAIWWIKQYISRYVMNHKDDIRYPIHLQKDLNKLEKASAKLENDNLAVDNENLHQQTGIKANKIEKLVKINPSSVEEFKEDIVNLNDELNNPQNMAEYLQAIRVLNECFNEIPEKYQDLLRIRYASGEHNLTPVKKIAEEMDITAEQARNLLTGALKSLEKRFKSSRYYKSED